MPHPMHSNLRPTWVEVDLAAIRFNLGQLAAYLHPRTQIMAVVKANAYGHGLVEVSRVLAGAGATWLGVATPEEALELRVGGIKRPILILGYTPPQAVPELARLGVAVTVTSLDQAMAFSSQALQAGRALRVQVKVDTGMGRLGFLPAQAVAAVTAVNRLPGLQVEGIFTHLAAADARDRDYTRHQVEIFQKIIGELEARGIYLRWKHAANSAALLDFPATHFNLVRPGIALYGYSPFDYPRDGVKLRPAMTFKTRIVLIKEVPAGTSISYGCTYVTPRSSRIATLPVGYADGYHRGLSNQGQVLIHGCRVPVVGRVCMDHLMVDVSDVPEAEEGDEVMLFGPALPAEELAEQLGTISYEVLCGVGPRVPRIYRGP